MMIIGKVYEVGEHMKKHKPIYILLDTLLILGALAVVATIDGGKLIFTALDFYRSGDKTVITPPVEIIPDTGVTTSSAQTAPDCLITPLVAIPEWYVINGMIASYNNSGQGRTTPGNTAPVCK